MYFFTFICGYEITASNMNTNINKIIIVFTDEDPQAYLKTSEGQKLAMLDVMQAAQGTPQLKIYIFSTDEDWEWDELAVLSGGKYYDLTNNPTEMYNSLMEILDEICKEGGAP